MSLLDQLRLNIGDDAGAIPSGIVPPPASGLPVGANTTSISELRIDIGDDDGIIPSGSLASGILIHNLLSPQHGDTTTATPSPGDLILGGGTWSAFPSGNEGEQLAIFQGGVVWRPDDTGLTRAEVTGIAVIVTTTGIAFHAADPDAHHTRYTDAEASGVAVLVVTTGIAEHTAISDAHHTRYTDAEAIAASSGALDHHFRYTDAEASGVAVQVVTTGILEHTNISDAHHTRYTDAEASGVAVLVVTTGIAQHTAIVDAHHTRYTDAEASGIAVQVTISGIAEHTAISGAHHDRYTDAEAVAAIGGTLPVPTGVVILQESGVELTADASTTSVLPTLSTLLSVPIIMIVPSGDLRILATAAINATGPVPVVFHIYIDGVFHRATTINVTGAIDNASIVIPRVAVSGADPHTVDLRWAKFGSPFVTVRCFPISSPDFYHTSLSVQEIL